MERENSDLSSVFLDKNSKVEQRTVIISYETAKNSILLHVTDCNSGKELFTKWLPKRVLEGALSDEISKGHYTGGLKPYAMLFYEEIISIIESGKFVGNVDSQLSTLVFLSKYIEMNTGRLIKRRKYLGKYPSLKREEIAEIIGMSERQTARILCNLKKNKFLKKNKDGYYIPRNIICRGKTVKNEV